jgi:lambda repressor-like predicted transcriptional regulator
MNHNDGYLMQTSITTVRLGGATKLGFLTALQDALRSDPEREGSLTELTPAASPDTYLIPHAAEEWLRKALKLHSSSQWQSKLREWGALSVDTLLRDQYAALQLRATTVQRNRLLSPPKISIAPHPLQRASQDTRMVPGDFAGPYDWHIGDDGIRVATAWRMFAERPEFQAQLPWSEVRVAHIDTGYTEHSALGWNQGSSDRVIPGDGRDLWDGAHDTDGPRDPFRTGSPGHGTRISGAISGFLKNAVGGPHYGAAPGVQIVPFRVTDSVIVDHVQNHITMAIRLAIGKGCHVVNISLGALRASRSLAGALDTAYDAGLIVVCAAGQVWGEVIYPGRFNRCVTMGGVSPGLVPWRSAAKGVHVDLCGPASGIRRIRASLLPPGKTESRMENGTGDGTSYATALCSGAAALWLAWHGLENLKKKYEPTGLWQIPKAFKYLARQSARPGKWSADEACDYGSGVLDVAKLLESPLPADGTMRKENKAFGPFDDGSL